MAWGCWGYQLLVTYLNKNTQMWLKSLSHFFAQLWTADCLRMSYWKVYKSLKFAEWLEDRSVENLNWCAHSLLTHTDLLVPASQSWQQVEASDTVAAGVDTFLIFLCISSLKEETEILAGVLAFPKTFLFCSVGSITKLKHLSGRENKKFPH